MVGAGWNGRALGGSDMAFTGLAPLTSSRRLSRGHFLISSCSMPVPAVDAALPTPCLTFLAPPSASGRSHHAGAHPAGQGPGGSPPRAPPSHAARAARQQTRQGPLPPGRAWRRRQRPGPPVRGRLSRGRREPLPRAVWDSSLRPPLFTQEAGASQPWGLGLETPGGGGRTQPGGGGPWGPTHVRGGGRGQVDPAELRPTCPGRAQGPRPGCRAALPRPVAPGAPDRGDPGARRRARHQEGAAVVLR